MFKGKNHRVGLKSLIPLLLCLTLCISFAQAEPFKVIDNGGNGPYHAIAVTEDSFKNYVVYRPENMKAAIKKMGKLPLVIFANGGCNDTSLPYERMLSEIASNGYLVIALGAMQQTLDDRQLNKAPNAMMTAAVDIIRKEASNEQSRYYQSVDLDNIAFSGQSCGGAQMLALAATPSIKTYMMFNSGMGDMTMAQASSQSLKAVHAPIVYLVGGESDVATANALLDYERLNHISVAFANHLTAGHSGTFEAPHGGSFARMAIKWLDWQLKQKNENAKIFLNNKLAQFPSWTMKAKNF